MRNERTQREQPEPEQPSWSAFSKASQTPAPARAASPKPAIAKQETAPEPAVASAPDATSNAADAAKRRKRPQKATPVQDEWGFFDPEQCGFAALLAKLDEITEKEEAFD